MTLFISTWGKMKPCLNYCGDNPFYQALNKELHSKRRAVIQAVNDKQNIASAVASMMGLGIGLTPSADDYLTGLALILFISGHPAEKYKEEFYLGLQRGRNNTTLLSAITLEAALQQRCRENIHRFIHNIIYDIPGNATQAIEKLTYWLQFRLRHAVWHGRWLCAEPNLRRELCQLK